MSILNASTRRPTTPAVAGQNWKTRSRCRDLAMADSFFSTAASAVARSRGLCLGCPVVAQCLTQHMQFDDRMYRYGVGGGLDPQQRRALAMEELLGNRPDLELARLLVSPRWLWRLRQLKRGCRSLEGMVAVLARDGLVVDEVTVRVAVWWSGGAGERVARMSPRDTRSWRRQLQDDYTDVIVTLHGLGARRADIAAYLGVTASNAEKFISDLVRDATAPTKTAAGMELAA